MPDERLIVGAMSGTSGDGVDVALTRISGIGVDMRAVLVAHHHVAFSPELKSLLFAIRGSGNCNLADLARLGREISLTYVDAVRAVLVKTSTPADSLACIAAHGQTLYHAPPNTIQWFDPSLVAYEIGCRVVSDFRRADCAAGGQGAPLVPFADYVLFRHPKINRIVVNIGGIANATCLFAGQPLETVLAFDTGPGNCISDHLMRKHGKGDYDKDGELALTGKIHRDLEKLLNDANYFMIRGPKSTDGPAMIAIFEESLAKYPDVSLPDQLATANHLTAVQIMRWRSLFGGQFDGELLVSGGGARNQSIMKCLNFWCGNTVKLIEEVGGPIGDAKEAIAFAILGAATLDGVPSNVPSVTGAKRSVVLGSITPKP